MKYTEENISHIIYCFAVLGHSMSDIGMRFGDSYNEIKIQLVKYGIKPTDRGVYGDIHILDKLKREITKIDIDRYVEINYKKLIKQPLYKYLEKLE